MVSLSDRNEWKNDETFDQSDEPLAMRHLTGAQKDQLSTLLESYLTELESGIPPAVESLTQSCPELREALQACVDGLESLHRMTGGDHLVSELPNGRSRVLGDFELHEEIGRGGMGIVYRATQISLRRTVAIKLLPLTSVLDSRQLTRFRQEAEAAASLQHPNIVPVHATGFQRGVHFYAMQFIKGESLEQRVARLRSNSPENAESARPGEADCPDVDWHCAVSQIAQIADGLHAAHELGIIHRDVKPSNLIIDENGKPWITDFGLARIQNNGDLTQSGDVIGTMRYMSPEQARGESAIVDGRTDVYSLGATLYEMLTGTPAHDGEDSAKILRQIDEGDVTPLRRRCPHLPRDLETVIDKAMAGCRDKRYETARAFALDLRRVLAGEPTVARPPTLLDHGVRLASKYRGAVATLAIVCVLALVGFAISNRRLADQKRVSEANAALALHNESVAREAIDRLGAQMAELLGDIPAANSVRHRLLNETLQYYQRLAERPITTGASDRAQLLDLAIVHGKIGSFQAELGLNADARRSLQESQQRFRKLAERYPGDTAIKLQWSISQNNLAKSYADDGEFDAAAQWFAEALVIQNAIHSETAAGAVTDLATTLNNLGHMLTDSENLFEAERVFQRAVELLDEVSENETSGQSISRHSVSKHNELRSTIQSNLAGLLVRQDPARAVEIARLSLRTQTDLLDANPRDAKAATRVVLTLNTLASAQAAQENHRNAIRSLNHAIEISGQLRRHWPDQASLRRDLGMSLNQLGLSLAAVGHTDRAVEVFEQAGRHARALCQAYADNAPLHSMLASTLNNLGFLKQQLGDPSAAETLFNEAIEHQRRAVQLAPQVPKYQALLSKHEHNRQKLREES